MSTKMDANRISSNGVDTCDQALSSRAEQVVRRDKGVIWRLERESDNAFHPVTNPKGNVTIAFADNKVCEGVMAAKIAEIWKEPPPVSTFYYGNSYGNIEFRQAMQRFLTKYFKPLQPIDVKSLYILSGTTTVIESLTFAFCEPGEYVMMTSPYYHRLERDVWERAGAGVVQVSTHFWNSGTGTYDSDIREDVLEECFHTAKLEGKTIRGIHFTSPTNPSGDVFTAAQINTLLKFAQRHELHVLANEIYGMTVFDPEVEFTSILSVPWPDPGRVHFAWGFSKDFGLSGFHIAALLTHNPRLQQYIACTSNFSQPVNAVQHMFQRLIDDEEWLDSVYFPTLKKNLRKRFESVGQALNPLGVKVHKSSASLFAWLDMTGLLPSQTEEGELWLFEEFVSAGVLLVPGTHARSPRIGFFRMCISSGQADHEEGLKRMRCVIAKIGKS